MALTETAIRKVKPGEKPLSIAVDELNQGMIKILGEEEEED